MGFLIFLVSFSSFASNPQIRTCNTTGGVFHSAHLSGDQVGFCIYGAAMMDSVSLLEVTTTSYKKSAVLAFEAGLNCSAAGGSEISVNDLEGHQFDVCLFSDSSIVELNTLIAGPNSSANAGLVQALETRY